MKLYRNDNGRNDYRVICENELFFFVVNGQSETVYLYDLNEYTDVMLHTKIYVVRNL